MSDVPTESEVRTLRSDRDISVDFSRLFRLIRQNRAKFIIIGLVSFLTCLVICATLVPQSFTSQISLSFPQTAQPTALNLLTGSGGTGSRYAGVLRSHKFAEEVADRADVQSLCGFATKEDAVEAVFKGVNVNDNIRDSLVYVSVSLPGPPRFAPGSNEKRVKVKKATASAANAYIAVLQAYMATSDTDRDAVLLRAANEQLDRARTEYEKAITQLSLFVTKPRNQLVVPTPQDTTSISSGMGAAGTGSGVGVGTTTSQRTTDTPGSALSSTAARELETLYVERGKLETDIQAASAAMQAGDQLRRGQLNRLNSLPEEDPLLASARAIVTEARMARDTLRLQLGPDHPDFIRAQSRLNLAETNLRKQIAAVERRDTTEDVAAKVTLKSLLARSAVVDRLIVAAEKKARRGLTFTQQFERKRNDVVLRLEVLKTTASQAAILSLQTISLKNRMSAVDKARIAKSGTPSLTVFGLMSICVSGLVLGFLLIMISMKNNEPAGASERVFSRPESETA